MKKKAIFISSTGGHLSELMMLEPLYNKFDYYIITEKTSTTKSLKQKYGERIKFLVYGTKKHLVIYFFKFIFNIIKSLFIWIKIRPNIIITTGTHTAVPLCIISHYLGTKVVFIETYANVITRTSSGNYIYNIADLFIVQWKEMLKVYPNAKYIGGIF